MGEILVAYDGSNLSKKALLKAASLLKENDELIVLHVIPSPILKEFAVIEPEISITAAQEIVNSAISELKERGIKVIGIVKEGDIADEILKLGNELECELIVLGSTGKTTEKIGRFLLGSVSDKVTKYSTRPVLIVR